MYYTYYLNDFASTKFTVCKQRPNLEHFVSHIGSLSKIMCNKFKSCEPVFDALRELRNGRKNETIANTKMRGDDSAETNAPLSAHGSNSNS